MTTSTSLPVFNLGSGAPPSFPSTPGTIPQLNPSGVTGLFSSTPFPSSLPQQAPALNISTLGVPAGTNQMLSSGMSLGPPATRPPALTLGPPGTQSLGLGVAVPQTYPPGSLVTQTQRSSLLGAPSPPQGMSLAPTGQLQTLQTAVPLVPGMSSAGGTGLGIVRGVPQTLGLSITGSPQVAGVSLGSVPASSSSTSAPVQVLSLGGALPQSGTGSAAQQSRPNDVKDTEIDPLLDQLVASLTGFIRQQKSIQSELCKMENRSLQSCEKEHRNMSRSLAEWKRGVSEYSSQVSSLKEDSIQDIRIAEVAQRTHELPSSLQGDHSDPKLYFHMLSCQFADRLQYYRQVVQELGKNFSQLDTSTKTPQEVSEIFKLINDNFLTLASNIYSLHTRVAQLKDNVQSYSNIYSKERQICFPRRVPPVPNSSSSGQLKSGPTPFSLSEASLLSHKYSSGTDLHMTGSSHTFHPAQSSPFGLSIGSRTQPLPLSSTLQNPANRFASFLSPSHAHIPQTPLSQKANQLPSINLSHPMAPSPTQYSAPAGFSPHRRGSISGESEESKRMK